MVEPVHLTESDVRAIVRDVLESGDFSMLDGSRPEDWLNFMTTDLSQHLSRQDVGLTDLLVNQKSLLDVVIGPVKKDWRGKLDPDGRRDESQGLKSVVEKAHNGGFKVKVPTAVWVAIISANAGILIALIELFAKH